MSATAFPLQWPSGRKRTDPYRRQASNFRVTLGAARDELFAEIARLGARHVVVSSNIPLRLDGKPYAATPRLDDPGVAAYFEHKSRAMCFACDRWNKVEDNMRAVAKTIDALRGVARWGTGDMMEAAFTGFVALPAPGGSATPTDWRQVLGVPNTVQTPESLKQHYRRAIGAAHPDRPDAHGDAATINLAYEKAKQELGYA